MKKTDNSSVSRRQFLTNAALVTGSVFGASKIFGAPAIISDLYKTGSLIKGVQIGVITYSFREMKDQSAEATLQYILDSGISATELMGDPAEVYAGRPQNPVDFRSFFPLMRKRREKQPLTDEENKKLDESEALMKEYNAEVKKWRLSAPMNKFEEFGKMYKKAGVKIYGFKPSAFGKDNSDEEVAYGMKAAKALGANQVTLEHPSDDAQTLRLGKIAEKYGVKVGYHGHEQQTPTFWDTALAQSPANGMNLDLGHFVAAGNIEPIAFVNKMHNNILSMHIKDRQNAAHGKGNLPWGTGDTPLVEVLKMMRDNKYKFPATVELEYKIPEGSDSVKEVQKCLEYCKRALS
ncbi:sugar phosphate isomerase/epimerase [Lacihabitans sp. LS3-19]|uniref:sugar phosphate isomerase/epimerase family protein n=1 Tax=Lacihabitans sp. LS3-19 TaxID=2487335 RepID=UPI0020CF8101|nr:TIM barrel protein [Lacihabitans sp. LS3-19]MCP9766548.1 sugar phosphate isomerase/epimerase [Lacihabitans sp. LS3-19]